MYFCMIAIIKLKLNKYQQRVSAKRSVYLALPRDDIMCLCMVVSCAGALSDSPLVFYKRHQSDQNGETASTDDGSCLLTHK